MTINLRYFSVSEANSLIPQLEKLFESIKETKRQIESKINTWNDEHGRLNEVDGALIKSKVEFLAAELERKLNEIFNLGCVMKDIDEGLIDFPARIGTKEGYLCWKLGEKKITHWHNLTEGFKGRKPLDSEDENAGN